MTNLRRFAASLALVCLLAPGWALAQQKDFIPPELQASDPQVKAYLDAATKSTDDGNYPESFQDLRNALDLCIKKNFPADQAIVEAKLSAASFLQGKLEDTKRYRLASFANSIKTNNLVLQADNLSALSVIAQLSGDMNEALKLAGQALDISRRSKNLWILSRASGELGRMQLLAGKIPEARASVEEALRLDRLNRYAWEASHLLYLAWITSTDDSRLDQALALAASARELAIQHEDYLTFMQASTMLAHGAVYKGKAGDGIALLEHSRDGLTEDGKPIFPRAAPFKAAMALPYPRIAFLETMARACQAANRGDDAAAAWSELYRLATNAGFTLAAAEAAHGEADLLQSKKEFENSAPWYALAAQGWAASGNPRRQMDALGAQAYALLQQGEGGKAVKIEEELLLLAKSAGDPRRSFLAGLFIAEVLQPEALQPRGETERAEAALREAESLLSPALTLPGLPPGAVLELFERLAGLLEKKKDDLGQLVALEKALTPAEEVPAARQRLDTQVREKLSALNARESAENALASGDFATALLYFELIQNFEQTDARWNGKSEAYSRNPDNHALKMSLELPFRLVDQPGGAGFLETSLRQLGPIAERARFPALVALSRHYAREGRSDKVVQFATAGLPYLHLENKDTPQDFDVEIVCELAFTHLLERDIDSALRRVAPCLNSAKKFGDPRRLALAHQLNLWALQAAGRPAEAQESAQFLARQSPDDPMHYVELALLKDHQGDHAEAAGAWRRALALYEQRKDPGGMASTHLSLAHSLGLAPSAKSGEDLSHLQAALALYQQLNDLEGQARASTFIGLYFARNKDTARTFEFLDSALKLAHRSKDAGLEAWVLSEIGNLHRHAGEAAKALDAHRKSGQLYRIAGDRAGEAGQLQNQAVALDSLRRPEEALETCLKARRLADISGSWLQRYWVRRTLADLHGPHGDFENALASLREARSIANAANQPLNSAWASLALAQMLDRMGDREDAVDALNLALPVFRQLKDQASESAAYLEFMDIYGARESEFKDFDKALGYYQSARQLAEKNDPAQAASLNLDAVEIYWQQKRFKEASALAGEALSYYQRRNDDWGQAAALLSLAEVQRSQGGLAAAADGMKRAEPFVQRANDSYLTARFYYGQAAQSKTEGRLRDAIEQYERVIALLEQFKSTAGPALRRRVSETYGYIYDELVDTLYELSRQSPASKLSSADHALRLAELNKSRVFTTAWGRTFLEALRRQLPARLQERERALTERQEVLQSELASGQGARPAKQVQEEKQVQEDLKRLESDLASLQNELRQASPAYAEARYPRAVSLSALPLRDGETFVEFKMLEDSLLVWIITGAPAGPPRLSAFYKVDHPRQWFEERILGIRGAFNRGAPDQFDPKVSEELFQALFPEAVARQITAAQSLILVPDDILFLLPFELLSPGASRSEFVLLKTPASYFPSAAALRLSRAIAPARREWPSQFFALADPITTADDERYGTASIISEIESLSLQGPSATGLSSGIPPPAAITQPGTPALPATLAQPKAPALPDALTPPPAAQPATPEAPALRGTASASKSSVLRFKSRGYFFERLPETANEARHIAALFPASPTDASTVVRTGTDATKRELLQTDLGQFRFLHFATHGFLPVEPGVQEPALILSYDGNAEDKMMLTMSEIVQLKLHAEMVVLSACNTGSGRVTRAEGVSSLGTSFLAAGASSVTVSLWQVSDESTALLMEEYYRNLLNGMPKNAALAAARAALFAKGHTNPFFWAPFVLTGE